MSEFRYRVLRMQIVESDNQAFCESVLRDAKNLCNENQLERDDLEALRALFRRQFAKKPPRGKHV